MYSISLIYFRNFTYFKVYVVFTCFNNLSIYQILCKYFLFINILYLKQAIQLSFSIFLRISEKSQKEKFPK